MVGAANMERQRNARRNIDEAIQGSERLRKPKAAPAVGMTARDVMTERQQHARECEGWASHLQTAIQEGIDNGVPDAILEHGVRRILELETLAEEQAAAAKAVAEARAALRATPIVTPVTKSGSAAAKRAATAGRVPLGEGSLVQLKGLDGVMGLGGGVFDVHLGEFNGRKGRVSKQPPPWVIKAVPEGAVPKNAAAASAAAAAHASDEREAATSRPGSAAASPPAWCHLGDRPGPLQADGQPQPPQPPAGGGFELVPVLLDSRHTDADRHRGLWVAVPHANIKVLQQ